jgi:predicted nucleic acid-binding protein
MKKLRIYLDTSVINFLFADDAPEFRCITREFFEHYAPRYELFVSDVVLIEIAHDPDKKHRAMLMDALHALPVTMLQATSMAEVRGLAAHLMRRGVIPPGKEADALHVACATVHRMDVLLSWNFKHLANVNKETRIAALNAELGYTTSMRLLSPLEVEYEEE